MLSLSLPLSLFLSLSLSLSLSPLPLQEAHLFLVCMSHSHPLIVGLQCDGCKSTIKATWYRDMDYDEDLDLCPKCFESKYTRGYT